MAALRWDESNIPSQRGKIAIVTGANSGIGFLTALRLAEHGAHVVLARRNEERGRQDEKEMRAALDQQPRDQKGTVELILVDMGSLTSPLSADGYETHFAVNHLSHFYLTTLLFDLLKKSPAARVMNVSSLAHKRSQMSFDTIVAESGYTWGRYGQSKLANLLFTYELSRRLEAAHMSNVLSVADHPGLTYTPIADKMVESIFPKFIHGMLKSVISWLPLQSSAMRALPTLYAATAEDVRNGEYFGPARFAGHFGHPVRETSQPQSHSKEEAQQLWQLSEELTKLSFHVSERRSRSPCEPVR